jgi:tRNA A37 threonylcarbamoyltransferase TsaD
MTRLRKLGTNVCEQSRADLAASTQRAIVDVLVAKSLRALKETGLPRLVVAGGVGANALLRETLDARAADGRCQGALSAAGPVHRQRCDDRARRGAALAARPAGCRSDAGRLRRAAALAARGGFD